MKISDDTSGYVGNVSLLILLLLSIIFVSNANAADINWEKAETRTIKAFYAGVVSWEYLKGEDHGTGADVVNKMRKTCQECHVSKFGVYDIRADEIISGKLNKLKSGEPLEPRPLEGMDGYKDISIQAAYDVKNLYLRFQWRGSGASVADPSLARDGRQDSISIQIANRIRSFRNYGCLMVCHDDQTDMPHNRGKEVKLYGYYTRKQGKIVSQDKLDSFLTKGQFIDMWTVSFVGNEVVTTDQYVLQSRIDDNNDLLATGDFRGGIYTVVITRKLDTDDTGDVVLESGKSFNLCVGIHDNKAKGRQHYTSISISIGLDIAADLHALKI